MKLAGSTKVHELLTTYPFLEDFLAAQSPRFAMLRNRMARATIGRVATLRTAAGIAGLDLNALLQAIAAEVEKHSGQRPQTELAAEAPTREQRLAALKAIIQDLHDGGDLAQAKARFSEAVEDVEASEIAAMEEELIRGGLPVSEVQRLCDVHVGAFREALDTHVQIGSPPGHPVDTYVAANRIITELANQLATLARQDDESALERAAAILERLVGVENHYQRKENQLFPLLERHGVTGPSQVMWGVHNQIRESLKQIRETVQQRDRDSFAELAPGLSRDLVEMVYKEEKILFPMALQTLSEEEWVEIRHGEDHLGYGLAQPRASWPAAAAPTAGTQTVPQGLLGLMTGALTLDQINLIFTHLPVDLTFVDENDTVRFYSGGPERIFPRSSAVIGRTVQNCHPPGSVHIVQNILDSFRAGKQSTAEFWIPLHGKFVHIRYLALRDAGGAYRGCLEVTQDVIHIRQLQGERRLLSWDSGG